MALDYTNLYTFNKSLAEALPWWIILGPAAVALLIYLGLRLYLRIVYLMMVRRVRAGKQGCPTCGGFRWLTIPCPEGNRGCAVLHTRHCPLCNPKGDKYDGKRMQMELTQLQKEKGSIFEGKL